MESVIFMLDSMFNDVNYSVMLLLNVSVGFGLLCKRSKNAEQKKWMSTGFGMVCLFSLTGFAHIWHVLMIGTLCAFVIVYSGKRKCHIAAFVLMFSYLAVFRTIAIVYGIKKHETIYMSLVQMMLTCKFVGVAFEIRNSFKEKQKTINSKNDNSRDNEEVIDPSICDILHYGFSFFGMISVYSNKRVPKLQFSLQSIYSVIQFQRFFFWLTSGLRMAEAGCAAAGLGAYPVQGVNKTSHGPTERYAELRKMSFREAKKFECDFNTINSMDIKEVQTTPWMSVQTRSWNKSFQYFMGTYIFTSIPDIDALKNYRILITVFISAFWHGLDSGYYIAMFTMPSYMFTERLYRTIYKTLTGWKANLLLFFMYAAKFYIISFGAVAFSILHFDDILVYLISIKFSPYILHTCMHMVGLVAVYSLNKNKKMD